MENQNDIINPKGLDDILKAMSSQRYQPKAEQDEPVIDNYSNEVAYSTLYHGLTIHFRLKPNESIVLAIILSFSRKKKYCWYSQNTFARQMNVSVPTVSECLKKLHGDELIEKGQKHPLYHTIQWRASQKTLYQLEYIQKSFDRIQEEKSSNKRSSPFTSKEPLDNN